MMYKGEVCCSFITKTVLEHHPRSHHKGATGMVRKAINSIQLYVIANLDKTS